MIKGKLVVVSNLTTFKTIQQSSDPIPDSAIVFIKNEGQIWTKGSYFGVQKTYDVVSKTDAGLAPKGGDSASSQIANVDDEWVLTVTNGANPSWRKLPANAFKNQTYTFYNLAFKNSSGTTVDTYKPSTSPSKNVKAGTNVKISASSNTITISATDTTYNAFTGASDSVDGSQGLVPKPTKGNQSKFLKADGSWATPTDTTYPIVSSTKDGLVPKFDANDGTIDQQDKDWVLTNNNGSIGWYKLPTNAFNNSTYSLVNSSSNGLVPILPTTNSTTISTQADEWVLTTTKGGEPSWRKLPTTAFYSLPTAKTNALGGIKVGSVSTSAFADLTGKYYTVNVDKNGVAYVNVPWTDTPYTLPTASSTLGGVKTTSTVSSTTGLTACPIIDGVVYYKDSDSNTWRGIYVGGTSKMGTANNTKALNFAAGNNVTISYAAPGTASGQSGNASYGTLTINATNTWTAWKGATSSANGTAGYMPAPTSAQRNQFLRGDGSWQSLNNYSLPTASSSTLGGVKTGAAITDTTGYTPVHIKDGVIYYKGSSTGYLPLSGGTLTGPLDIFGEQYNGNYGINMNNSDIINVNSITLADTCNAAGEGVKFVRTDNKYDSIWAVDGTLYFSTNGTLSTQTTTGSFANDYSVYHSGNCTLLDATRLCSAYGTSAPNNINNRPTSANITFTDKSIRYFLATSSMTEGKPTVGDSMIIQTSWDNNGWNSQLAFPTSSTLSLQWRGQGDSSGQASQATVWGNWKTILDSSNYTSYCATAGHTHPYLPLSGGNMTGPLSLPANMYGTEGALNMNNSNIINVNSIFTSDNAEDAGEGIQFARNNGNYDSIWCSGGVFYFSPNGGTASQAYNNNYTVIHSGNYTSYLSGGSWNGGTVTNEITISRNTSGDTMLKCLRTDTGYSTRFGMGSGGVNRGIWDDKFNKWVFYCDASNTYITNNTWIYQDAWNNGLCLNRTVSGGGCAIKVHSNGTYLGEFGIAGNSTFEVDIAGSTVMTCDSGGNLNVKGSLSIAGNKLTFVT